MKTIFYEIYKGHKITIESRFIKDHYIWGEGRTNVVELTYKVIDSTGEELYIRSFQTEIVPQDKPKRFLFWTRQPKMTFEEKVKEELNDMIQWLHKEVDRRIFENEVTDGLMDSLKQFN